MGTEGTVAFEAKAIYTHPEREFGVMPG